MVVTYKPPSFRSCTPDQKTPARSTEEPSWTNKATMTAMRSELQGTKWTNRGTARAPFDGAPSPVDCGWMVSGLSGQLNTAALLVLVLMGTETASILLMVMMLLMLLMLLMFLLHCAAGVAHEVLRSAYHAQRHVPVSRDNLFEMKLSGIKDPLPLQDEA